jgi:hypothetical protein
VYHYWYGYTHTRSESDMSPFFTPTQVRAGLSYSEERNQTLTNPVWKTAAVNGLSETGTDQVGSRCISWLISILVLSPRPFHVSV